MIVLTRLPKPPEALPGRPGALLMQAGVGVGSSAGIAPAVMPRRRASAPSVSDRLTFYPSALHQRQSKRGTQMEVTQAMAWEGRPDCTNRYYTRSRKMGGRVVREYIGRGPLADLAAAQDAAERQARSTARERLRVIAARDAPAFLALAKLDRLLDGLAAAHLLEAGYHRHHRGEWRRRRHGAETTGR
jgi:hypothetical protein